MDLIDVLLSIEQDNDDYFSIVLLKFPVGMHNGNDPLSEVRVVSRHIRGPKSRQLHMPHTITEPPPA
ncbi:hypothetical protein TNCV_2953741 [Trichonephila clavipes]|nr:hypothetical protein TNCV_2953741 [Trichonephila clavipes]